MTVPSTEPKPPARLVPPSTTAAMASNSYPVPAVGCAELKRAVMIIPAKS